MRSHLRQAKRDGENQRVKEFLNWKIKMDIALTMEQGLSLETERPLEGALAFLASRSKRSASELSVPAGEVFKGIASLVDQLLVSVLEKRTAVEFRSTFTESFPKYVAMTLALSHFARVIVPPDVVDRLTRESICELETDFRDKSLSVFGASVRDQALFTVWTLRKINDLLVQIAGADLDEEKREADKAFCLQFSFYSLRAHFGLDCLNMALDLNRPIYPEVMEEMKNCLRAMVNAYAWARQGAALRIPANEPTIAMSFDEDDEELLASSMQDMAVMMRNEESV